MSVEQRLNSVFSMEKNRKNTMEMLVKAYSHAAMKRTALHKWYSRYETDTKVCWTSITSQKKRAPLLPTMLFHHDNAPSHQASMTQETIDRRPIEVLGHPPYSPDLAPCDFFLFPTLKKILRG